jgi:hypothetical protein
MRCVRRRSFLWIEIAARLEYDAAKFLPLDSEINSESPALILPLHFIFGRLLATELVAPFTPAMHMIFVLCLVTPQRLHSWRYQGF